MSFAIPPTTLRVPLNTSDEANESIRQQTDQNVACYANRGPDAIARRLRELDDEWDIERTLEANAASMVLLGMGLGATVDRRFFLLPAVVAGFLLQHAVQGWCPPVPLFRRWGVRTASEIDEERYALKALRGDFRDVQGENGASGDVSAALRAVRGNGSHSRWR